ncbi:hypothetical protein [Spirosoma oryzicola]|uniref:hypothetical protein n=1 Tax=Spirosoma oryzicola TaxID=2898794 RepID=UPI001E3F6551|nr:hypothetical protein [Spirosoma oryzicola]UHG93261.1 hypothetical protein LQ777_10250 [Spirosoma oryzicola]
MKTLAKIALLALTTTFLSCEASQSDDKPQPEVSNPEASCNVADPINDLDWLKSIVTTLNSYKAGYRAVKLVDYQSKPYFVVEEIYSSSPASTIYDCQGNKALKALNVTYNQFITDAKEVKVLYSKN